MSTEIDFVRRIEHLSSLVLPHIRTSNISLTRDSSSLAGNSLRIVFLDQQEMIDNANDRSELIKVIPLCITVDTGKLYPEYYDARFIGKVTDNDGMLPNIASLHPDTCEDHGFRTFTDASLGVEEIQPYYQVLNKAAEALGHFGYDKTYKAVSNIGFVAMS